MIPIMQRIFPAFANPALLEPAPILALENPRHASRMLTSGIRNANIKLNIPNTRPIVAALELSTVCTGTTFGIGLICSGAPV